MTAMFHRLISAGVLVAFGSVICAMYFNGRIDSYLVPAFRIFSVACGCALVLLAVLLVLAPSAENAAQRPASLWKSGLAALFLVAPLLAAVSLSKDEFGATAVRNRNYVQDIAQLPSAPPPAVSQPAINDGETSAAPEFETNGKGALKAEVIDFLYAAQLPDMRAQFENKPIEVIGQLMPAKSDNPRGDRYDLVRMLMTCCSADVQPIALPIHPGAKPTVPDMTWVKVSGTATFPIVGGQRRPLIENATVGKTDPPEETYLY